MTIKVLIILTLITLPLLFPKKKRFKILLFIGNLILLFVINYFDWINKFIKYIKYEPLKLILVDLSRYLSISLSEEGTIAIFALVYTVYIYNNGKSNSKKEDERQTILHLIDMLNVRIENISEYKIDSLFSDIDEKLKDLNENIGYDMHRAYQIRKRINKPILYLNLLNIYYLNITKEKKKIYMKQCLAFIRGENIGTQYRLLLTLENLNLISFENPTFSISPSITKYKKNIYTEINDDLSFFRLISKRYNDKKALQQPITYNHAFRKINIVFKNEDYFGALFRTIHRTIKIINESSFDKDEKKKYIGILRSQIPDNILMLIYYNCTYSDKGRGLGLQLVGTSLFGDEKDFTVSKKNNGIILSSQHIISKYLIFRRQDTQILLNVYNSPFFNNRTITEKKFKKMLDKKFEKLDKTYLSSFKL